MRLEFEKVGGSTKIKIEARTARRSALEPLQAIRAMQFVPGRAEAVQHEIVVRPIEIGVRQIDAHAAACAAGGGVDRCAARITEQIEKIRILGPLAQHLPDDAMIEKQARIQVIAEVDPKLESAFLHGVPLGVLHGMPLGVLNGVPLGGEGAFFVLLAPLLRLAHPRVHMRRRHRQDVRQHRQRLTAAFPRALLIHGFWRSIFLHVDMARPRGRRGRWRTRTPACRRRRRESNRCVHARPRTKDAAGSCAADWRTSARRDGPTNPHAPPPPDAARPARSNRNAAAGIRWCR